MCFVCGKDKPMLIQGLMRNYPHEGGIFSLCNTRKAIEYRDKLLKNSTYDKV